MKNIKDETISQFIVVIRSANERTMAACKTIVCNEIPEEKVHILQLTPFEEALRESYRIGINSGRKWLVTIDADLLPRQGFMERIALLSSGLSDKVFSFKAMIYDKFFSKHRLAGFRVYRCSMLKEALSLVPENGKQIRPEQYTVNLMEARGYQTKVFEYVVGIHDYEQYNKDLYRKAFFHATKHPQHVAENLAKWKELSNSDNDYRVMIKGAVDGLLSSESPTADLRFFKSHAEKALSELNITEKKPAEIDLIQNIIEKEIDEKGEFYKEYSMKAAKKRMEKYGNLAGAVHHIGFLMETAGKLIRQKIDR